MEKNIFLKPVTTSKQWLTFVAVLWILISVSGCSDLDASVSDGWVVPLTIAGSTIGGTAQSRGTLTEGSIGVFLTNANGYTPKSDIQYEYRTDKWVPTVAKESIMLGHQTAKVFAYYPYGKVTNAENSTVTLVAQPYGEEKEFFYATSGGNLCNATPTAIFNMKRAYARLKLSIGRDAGRYKGAGVISNINLKNGSTFSKERTLNIADGTITGSTVSGGWSLPYSTTIAEGSADSNYDVLLPPQQVESGLTVTLTIDGKVRAVTVPPSRLSAGYITAGKQYRIKLTISDAEISVTGSVTVSDFSSGSNTNTDASWD